MYELTNAERAMITDELEALVMGCDDQATVETAEGIIAKLAA